MRAGALLGIVMAASLAAGCRSVSPQTVGGAPQSTARSASSRTNAPVPDGTWHGIIVKPRPDLPQINPWQKFNPVWWLGNADDPVPPSSYRPHDKCRKLKWYLRNPFHNFDFYVIGVADKEFVRSGKYPNKISNPYGGWNFAISKYRFWRLPFISYQHGRFNFYCGWRNRGNFGIKINFQKKRTATQNRESSMQNPESVANCPP